MNDNKTIAKNTVIIYIRLILSAVIGVFASRFILRALGAGDYGLYNVVGSVVAFLTFINTVMVATTYRFIAFEIGRKEDGKINKIFNISRSIHIILALIVLVVAATAGVYYIDNYLNVDPSRLSDAKFVFWCSIIACMLSIINVPYVGLLTAYEKFIIISIIEICRQLLILSTSIGLFFSSTNRLRLYAILMALVVISVSLLYMTYCSLVYKEQIRWSFQKDKKKYKEMIGFSGWIAIGAAASVGQQQGAAIIVNHFFGTLLNAAYGIALTVNNVIGHFSRAIAQAAAPQITKKFSGEDQQGSVDIASYISKYTVFFMLLMSVPLLLETNFVIDLWLGKDAVPEYTIILCQLTIINLCIGGFGEGLNTLIQATGKIKWFQIIMSNTALLSLPLSWILYKYSFSPYTIVNCFILMALINLVVRQLLLNKLLQFNVKRLIQISYLKVVYVIIAIIPWFVFVPLFPEGWFRFLTVVPCSVIYTILIMWIFGTDKGERSRIKQIIMRK